MKITWLQNFTKDRQDSIWYGGDIVSIEIRGYIVYIGAYGDLRVIINGWEYVDKNNGGMFVQYLEENGIHNDTELKEAIQNGTIEFLNNNWFEAFVWDKRKKDWVGNSWDCVIDELSVDDDFAWIEDWIKAVE